MALKRIGERLKALQQRQTQLVNEYGPIALLTLIALSLPIYAGFFWVRWRQGGLTTFADVLTTGSLAWAANRATWPFRIVASLTLTPFIARFLRKRAAKKGGGTGPQDGQPNTQDEARP